MITPSDLGILENNRKEIYIAKKIPDLQLEIKGRESESYNLIVA
jgi:hypothetical protein